MWRSELCKDAAGNCVLLHLRDKCAGKRPQRRASRGELYRLSIIRCGFGRDGKCQSLARREPRTAVVFVVQHRMCPARMAAAECEVPVLNPVDEGDCAKAVTASAADSSMLHERIDLAVRAAASKALLWRPAPAAVEAQSASLDRTTLR